MKMQQVGSTCIRICILQIVRAFQADPLKVVKPVKICVFSSMVSKNVPNKTRKSGQTRKKIAGPWESIPMTLNFADLEAKYKGNCKPVNATRQGNSAVRTRAPVTFRHGTRRNLAGNSPFTATRPRTS